MTSNVPTPTRVEVNEDLFTRLFAAQRQACAEILLDPHNRFADDWGDYTSSVLELTTIMFDMVVDQDPTPDLEIYLNTPVDYDAATIKLANGNEVTPLWQLACDGIANEFYELNCPALPKDD